MYGKCVRGKWGPGEILREGRVMQQREVEGGGLLDLMTDTAEKHGIEKNPNREFRTEENSLL